jgi:fimbrial chaperone protein
MGKYVTALGRNHFLLSGLLAAPICAAGLAPTSVWAGTLEVSPINLEVPAATQATTETLTNMGKTPINAQVRAFKWIQKDGIDKLEPTTDVVASPPALKIPPGVKATIRVVRLTKTPITGEETYRLLIDDIPPPPSAGTDSVSFAVRHNIPVFFQAAGIKTKLVWTAKNNNGQLELDAKNDGLLHARLAQLAVNVGGVTTNLNNGLAGYVLAGGINAWKMKLKALKAGTTVKITASSNDGPVEATVQVQ